MFKFLRRLLIALSILLVLAQLYPKDKKNNSSAVSVNDIGTKYTVPDNIQAILKSSCYDCHSNNTAYPWYSKVQPIAWWLGGHIAEGKKNLNFSEFTIYSLKKQFRKLKEIQEQIEEDEMPLSSYTFIHRYANLTGNQKKLLLNWVSATQDSMKTRNPAASLL
ncbi:MAG: heme-binding domain-containing protein [Ferruginibacter sp.]